VIVTGPEIAVLVFTSAIARARVEYVPLIAGVVLLGLVTVTVTCPQTPPLISSNNTTRKLKFLNTLILLDSEENRKSVDFFIIVCFGNIYYRMFKKDMIYEIKKNNSKFT
jgi:hypothetical protein